MKTFGICVVLLALSACGESIDPAVMEHVKRQTAEWKALEDGSSFARVENYEKNLEVAMRCWPGKTDVNICLSVVKNTTIGEVITVSRHAEATLPEVLWGLSGNGYRCEYVMGQLREEISAGASLTSNRPRETGKAWSAGFVDDYMTKNDLTGPRHFRCFEVLNAVMEGSLQTLGTTSITKSMAI